MTTGTLIAIIGAGIAAVVAGLGSVFGVQNAGRAAAGVCSEKPDLFGKLLLLEALPGTQGIYGFIVAFLVMLQLGVLSGDLAQLTKGQGWAFFGACLPIAIVGFVSAVYQGRTAVSAIHMTAKQPDASSKGMTITIMVETYAVLALLTSALLVLFLPVS